MSWGFTSHSRRRVGLRRIDGHRGGDKWLPTDRRRSDLTRTRSSNQC